MLWRVEVPFVFGDYALNPDRRELTPGSLVIPTGPQVFDLLGYLVQNPARGVSKDDLLPAGLGGGGWSETTPTRHITALRKTGVVTRAANSPLPHCVSK